MARKLTRILDKLVQVGPSYLDQTLRSYATENKEYRLYEDKPNDPTANTYAVFSFFSSGIYKAEEPKVVDMLLVGGGGGGSIGNLAGGSGGGGVVEIKNALLPAGTYKITIGAGGAGGITEPTLLASGINNVINPDDGINQAQGSSGSDTSFETLAGDEKITALGGGPGGFRKQDTIPVSGGSGGGAGGADDGDTTSMIGQISDIDTSVTTAITNGYLRPSAGDTMFTNYADQIGGYDNATLLADMNITKHFGNSGGNSDAYGTSGTATYSAGGGGGAGVAGEKGNDFRGGNGGDGISLEWVNEVFQKVYKFNGDIFWGAGGGGAAAADKEPGAGGKGGGGGGAAYRVTGNTPGEIFNNGKRGELGYNEGYDGYRLKGGAGGQNTGSGAGGSCTIGSAVYTPWGTILDISAFLTALEKGNNGGSGFALIRVHMSDNPAV